MMAVKKKQIPVNATLDSSAYGISVDRLQINNADFKTVDEFDAATGSHRDAGHSFHLVEKGSVLIEIDLRKYRVRAGTIVYMHPSQVHRILSFRTTIVYSLSISTDQLAPKYLALLEEISPTKPVLLGKDAFADVVGTFSLLRSFSQKNTWAYTIFDEGLC